MKQTCKLYVVRHGQSVANVENISGGNSELTDIGVAQAGGTKRLLTVVHFDAVYSSDRIRAVKTAEIITGMQVPSEHQLPGLRERYFGRLEDKPADTWYRIKDEYEARYANLPFKQRIEHEYDDDIEGDKSLVSRCMASLRMIAERHTGQTVLVGTHAGPIRDVLMYLGYAEFLTVDSFKNAGYVELVWADNKFTVGEVIGLSV